MTISHAERLDNTVEALDGDVTKLDDQGPKTVDSWISALERTNKDELKPIVDMLNKLKDELGKDKLNGGAIGKLLTQLGEKTTEAADLADDDLSPKVKKLGQMLSKAGKKLA